MSCGRFSLDIQSHFTYVLSPTKGVTIIHVGISGLFVKKNARPSPYHDPQPGRRHDGTFTVRCQGGRRRSFHKQLHLYETRSSLQMYPTTHMVHQDAVARFYSIIVDIPGLPSESKAEIDKASEESDKDMM